jgi:probable F420-dependent oxidoreductase
VAEQTTDRPTIQISTGLPTFAREDPGTWDHLLDAAGALDAAGFDRVVMSDHVVFGEDLEAYGRPELGGQAGGRQPTGPDGHWLEPITTLAVLAGITSRVRLGTNILLAALRRPVVLAKSAATLDVLSGGRLDLGVGVGWQQAEYDAAGLDFHRRGKLLDLSLEACQVLWREQVATFASPDLTFGPTHMMPKPRQAGGVPFWISGTINPSVVRRITRFGSGWIPWGADAADPATAIPRMKEAVAAAGGDADGLQVVGSLRLVRHDDGTVDPAASFAPVPDLVAAGVTDVRVGLKPDDLVADRLDPLVGAFREATAAA